MTVGLRERERERGGERQGGEWKTGEGEGYDLAAVNARG